MNVIIMGASSGLGAELALMYMAAGHRVGAAARRADKLPACTVRAAIDVNSPSAPEQLSALIEQLGGMDLYIHVAGIGYDNPMLDPERDTSIAATNCCGFVRMISAAFNYFSASGRKGHIAAVSSVAGTKGIAGMEAYCASKRFDWTYLQGLRQRACRDRLPICITDIRPGWTRTPLLRPGASYPMLMDSEAVCRRIVKAISRRRKRVVINRRWALLQFFWALLPDALWRHLNSRYYQA